MNIDIYEEMKRLTDKLIDLSDKNGLACLVSFETKILDTCYVSFVGTADKLGYTVNFMERSLEGLDESYQGEGISVWVLPI